jgi:toxin ParE1/3/4
MRVRWSPRANRDRASQLSYVADESPRAALKLGELIEASVTRLEEFPNSGRPGRLNGTRELVIPRTPYVAIYRISESTVEIVRFLHGAQRWPHPRRAR